MVFLYMYLSSLHIYCIFTGLNISHKIQTSKSRKRLTPDYVFFRHYIVATTRSERRPEMISGGWPRKSMLNGQTGIDQYRWRDHACPRSCRRSTSRATENQDFTRITENKERTCTRASISRWWDWAPFFWPNGFRGNSNSPHGVMTAILLMPASWTKIWLYPRTRSFF